MSEGAESSEQEMPERSTASAIPETEAREGYKWVQLGPKNIEIPNGWETVSLSQVIDKLETGNRPKTENRDPENDDILSVGGTHIQDESFDFAEPVYISEEYYSSLSSGQIRQGDILLVKDGATIGKSIIVDTVPGGRSAVNSHVYIIRTGDSTDSKYLYAYLSSRIGLSQILRLTTGSAQAGLNRTFTDIAKIPLPPLPEQRRIAEVLSTVDEQIRQTETVIETAEELKRGLMQDLYESGYGAHQDSKDGPFGTMPADWELGRIESHAEVISGTHVRSDLVTNDPIQTPYLTGPADFERTGFEVTKYTDSPKKFCEAGDVLVTVKGMGCGQSALADQRVAISRQLKSIRPGESLDQQFLFYWLRRKEQILNILAEGTRQPGLSVSDIETFPLPIPPLEEQQKIGETLSTVERKTVDETEYRDRLQELKRGLMQDLLSGTVRVPESIGVED